MSFKEFAYSHGLLIPHLPKDREIRRCATTQKPNSLNGAYKYDAATDHGWCQNWGASSDIHYYRGQNFIPNQPLITQDDLSSQYAEAVEKANLVVNACQPGTHPYLLQKKIEEEGYITDNGELIIPMFYYADYSLVGYQRIFDAGGGRFMKKMCNGMRAKGAVHILGDRRSREYIFCEGYATGWSLRKAIQLGGLDIAVVVCFSANNLAFVGKQLKSRRGSIYADNDKSKTGVDNAIKTGLLWIQSPVEGNDANDDHINFGLPFVLKQICKLRGAQNESV